MKSRDKCIWALNQFHDFVNAKSQQYREILRVFATAIGEQRCLCFLVAKIFIPSELWECQFAR